ncbi:MAG: T9SS type A sorting domain-containing protein [Ignavibacteria bacterium]|nr:T9SS type A sorting domain-containing protein [Ignavibacteria bacterium]
MIISNQKYNQWFKGSNPENDVTNHHLFLVDDNFPTTLKSQFQQTYSGVTIKNEFLESIGLNPLTDNVDFKDPWLIDYPDPSYGNNSRNRGLSAIFKPKSSPFFPDYTTNYSGDVYKGIFLNQNPSFNSQLPIYSVRSLSQDIDLGGTLGVHKFYNQNWSGTNVSFQYPNNTETAVVFTSSSAVVTANLKGTQLSSQTNAYTNNSQRKFVRTDDGWLHSVYESMGRVWYETKKPSSDWQIMNDGKPLDSGEGKQPSIDYSSLISPDGLVYQIVIVYQEKSGSSSKIRIKYFKRLFDELNISFVDDADIATISGSYSTTNTTPVVGFHQTNAPNTTNTATVIWKNGTGNLYGWYGTISSIIGTIQGPNSLTGTTSNSINPTIYVAKIGTRTTKLAWEETGTGGAASIKYAAMGNSQISGSITTPSTNSGYTKNYQPSIIEFNGGARLCWIGYVQYSGGAIYYYVTVFKDPAVVTQFWNFGNEVRTVNINRTADGNYVVGWSEVNGSVFTNKYVRSTTLSAIKNFGTTGKDIQVNNGANFYSQYANSFQSATVPYNFSISNSVGNIGKEQAGSLIASGREGVVYKDEAQFYFTVGDIIVNEQNIEFVDVPDTLNISSREILNGYLISDPFEVNDNSIFTYGVQYGITDSASGYEFLDDNHFINYKVELRDDATGELIGLFDDITFTKTNLNQYNNISYQVNTQGIGSRTVRLKLVIDDNLDPGYSLSHKYADESVLLKTNQSNVSYKGTTAVENYDLSQNYPNPFNPFTTIKYQIPEDGIVTMKIYDILGKEVKTLVNEQKHSGRYEVQFDAGDLASGVYIYRIQVNDFVSVKKLMLLK